MQRQPNRLGIAVAPTFAAMLACACSPSPATSVGPGTFSGGAPDTYCTVETNEQACWHDPAYSPALPTMVFCDPSTATWTLVGPCKPDQFCVETAVPGKAGMAATCTDKYDGSLFVDAADAATAGDASAPTDAASTADGADTSPDVADSTPLPIEWSWLVISDDTKTCVGTGPGADIDTVALYRNGKLVGVGKPDSATYQAAQSQGCDLNGHNDNDDIAACTGPLGDIDPSKLSTGYLSLGGGQVVLQIGACTASGGLHDCTGQGEAVVMQAGDRLDIYEVDTWYLDHNNPNSGKPYITAQCKCDAEPYTVHVRKAPTPEYGQRLVGSHTGTAIKKLLVPNLDQP